MTSALHHEGFPDDLLLESGVVDRARTGRLYDRMRGRVIFPILDQHGAPRGFAGRLLVGDGPKYLNTPETDLYQKRSLLYGMHLAHQPILEAGKAIIVEGCTDAIAAHQAGFTNVVATGGTTLTGLPPVGRTPRQWAMSRLEGSRMGEEQQARRARRKFGDEFKRDAVKIVDSSDKPIAEVARELGIHDSSLGTRGPDQNVHLQVARLPAGKDPADLIAEDKSHLLHEAIASAIPLEHHLIDQIIDQHNLEEPEAIARAIRAARSVVSLITDPTARTQTVAHLANRIGRDDNLIQEYLQSRTQPPGCRRDRDPGRILA